MSGFGVTTSLPKGTICLKLRNVSGFGVLPKGEQTDF